MVKSMPVGVICNVCSVLLGGIFGSVLSNKIPQKLKTEITLIFGVCSFGMGLSSITLMKNMPAVVFSVILGTILGISVHLGDAINKIAGMMKRPIAKLFHNKTSLSEEEFMNQLVTIIVLFCASGTGIYGALVSGMTGDHSVLISKSILDFFTAAIFACNLGAVVSAVSIPQFCVEILLFLCAGLILPMTTPDMIADFKACGGFLMLATGFRMMKVQNFPIADMLPAMVLVMPVSWLWTNLIMQLL